MENYLTKIVECIKQHPVNLSTGVTQGGDGRIDKRELRPTVKLLRLSKRLKGHETWSLKK